MRGLGATGFRGFRSSGLPSTTTPHLLFLVVDQATFYQRCLFFLRLRACDVLPAVLTRFVSWFRVFGTSGFRPFGFSVLRALFRVFGISLYRCVLYTCPWSSLVLGGAFGVLDIRCLGASGFGLGAWRLFDLCGAARSPVHRFPLTYLDSCRCAPPLYLIASSACAVLCVSPQVAARACLHTYTGACATCSVKFLISSSASLS